MTIIHIRVTEDRTPHERPVRTEGEAPSAPPTSVRSDAVSPTSLRVVWEPPPAHTHHGDLLGYHVGVRRHDLGNDESYNFSVVGVGAGGGGREVVTALRAWVQYAVAVRAYNAHGAGPVSPPVVVRTLEDAPSSPPVGVECSGGAGGTSLYVRWAPPPPAFHNGLLQGYRLTLTRLDDSTEKVEELIRMTNGREESVGGLRAWSNYTVTVAAVTRAGAGVSSPDLICTTREDVAGVPGGLRALQSDHPLHAHANSHSLTHLSRGTHEFWLTARTRAGEGKPTPTIKLTILDQVPAGVASLGKEAVATLGDDVRFVCVTVGSPPPMPSWSVDGRHLEKDGRFTQEADGSLVIRGVERSDRGNYTCSIHSVRKSPYVHTSTTYVLHVQVPPTAPSVHIADATSSTLTVSWAAGDTGGAPVRAWAVWWRAAVGGGVWHTRELGRTHSRHVINELQCGTEYQERARRPEDQEAEQNKTNLLQQRDTYYATVRKPQPVPATLERIPEYSEDIYPYATFQLGEGRGGGQDETVTNKFQTFVFQDSRYGVTEGHPPTSSDTDTEHATSSRTESSIHLDSATLESHHTALHLPLDPHLATLEPRPDAQAAHAARRPAARTVHHNLIYHAPESSTSTEPSPILERKSFPRKSDGNKLGRGGAFQGRGLSKMVASIRGGTQETSLSFPKAGHASDSKSSDDGKYGFARQITPPVGFSSSHNELSEAECDLEMRRRNKEAEAASAAYVGHSRSQFRSYVSGKEKDYSIKV
ncbi:putative Down syndrome cell adhesion molecule-like protein Dscam2 [Penaeus vannamei]|uniref:Putative Down syndrome cell adhesion molecule-like protein Dscam2 n=1 Tax=Penaeus vannamei TaxID=6689 RepID=A0A423SW09_PENVA|nr:putative Down syndrome cell adhesion molecule-like protein Dscam2 [Penaeus vannamei]